RGAQVVLIGPDYSPSAIHTDLFVPVRIGSDAALALAMCRVIIEEGLMQEEFVREQTDLPLLVRRDNGRFLRQQDVVEGGSDEIFYLYDEATKAIVEAPRTLALGGLRPALRGAYKAMLAGGTSVDVVPVFVRLEEQLKAYSPEAASAICDTHPDVIRKVARMIAGGKTHVLDGWTFGKSYHGDLMERAICLVLALTGNWGKQGAGIRSWAVGMFDGLFTWSNKPQPGFEAAANMDKGLKAMAATVRAQDASLTNEILMHRMAYQGTAMGGTVPPAFFWLNFCGYREIWDRPGWGDPTMKRTMSEYVDEAINKGWWQGSQQPLPSAPPRVLFEIGGSMLRRTRGGQHHLTKTLWPKLNLIVTIDVKMSTTGMWSDIVLPAA
ncbi:MAG: ethylbenzene dehydrogenase, partial [Dehalococcoidia bacterium]